MNPSTQVENPIEQGERVEEHQVCCSCDEILQGTGFVRVGDHGCCTIAIGCYIGTTTSSEENGSFVGLVCSGLSSREPGKGLQQERQGRKVMSNISRGQQERGMKTLEHDYLKQFSVLLLEKERTTISIVSHCVRATPERLLVFGRFKQ